MKLKIIKEKNNMCGIIGIASSKPVSSAIINSLRKLEYRGYDSAGIATLSNGILNEVKSEGRVDILEKNSAVKNMLGSIGIGHVRWATHGVPNTINAHPHSTENVSVVHNGIIENSTLLKKHLISKGHIFKSQTDTEVIVHLIAEYLKELNLKDAIIKTLKQLHGSFALGIIFKDQPNLIVGARRGSPLAVGYGPNENYLGSDSYALKSMTNKISYLNDGEFCIIKKNYVEFFDEEGLKVNKKVLELSSKEQDYDKGDFKHFMAKEIEEQPITLKNCINEYIDKINNDINIYNFPWDIKEISSVTLIGCGTAYHSCLMAKYWFEENTSLDVTIDIASEFRYRKNRFKNDNLYIFVSQSGETADTYAALDLCNKNNMKTCSVVNVIESSIARESKFVLPIHCGPEIGVASTKAFMGQMLVLYIFVLKLGILRKETDKNLYINKIKELKTLPKLVEQTLLTENKIQTVSSSFADAKGSMFLGRGFSFPIALEGALKLKELAYVHAEGYPAGEMKHGPLALIEDGIPVVVLAPRDNYYKKTISNMQEVIARGAKVLLITNKSKDEVLSENIWETVLVESASDDLLPFLLTVPLQKLAYYSALKKGYDIDKPRNLAKSVTVE
ncbi:glutamine--fructose-6-phosphate transaminase (isomerizing) [Candidatus Pelagibacter sp.]|nr:glutamine--fructose-6-phosphate transaminase (isomerizing) [Candidatus Pelagibacter sp.]MDB4081648.1 glutamine--fructose-6-phosphate transaminase (isomerizing) [Candidatus Pelagibacter sp.]